MHLPVIVHVAVVAVPLAAHGAPYTPPKWPLWIGFTVRRLCRDLGTDLESVPAPNVVDERRHVALVRVTHAAHGSPGFGMRRVHVPVVLGRVIGQVAAQFTRQRRPIIWAGDVATSITTVMRTVICAHGRSEKSPTAAGHVTR